jgi:hypothetical protein
MPSRRQSLTREELKAERMTGRINRRIRVMAVFTSRAGELLDSGAVAAVTGMPLPPRPSTIPGATRPGERVFFCRHCRRGVTATDPPNGWLRLQVRDDDLARRYSQTYATRGLYCSLPCLSAWAISESAEPAETP